MAWPSAAGLEAPNNTGGGDQAASAGGERLSAEASVGRRLLSGALGGLALTVTSVGVSLLQLSLLLRHMPLETAGIWVVVLNLGSYVLILDLGLSPTLGREISFAAGAPQLSPGARQVRIATLIRSCTAIALFLAAIVAVLGAAGGWMYLRTVSPDSLHATLRRSWFVFVLGSAMNLVGQGWLAGMYGLGHVLEEKLVRSANLLLGLAFMAVAIYMRGGLLGLAVASLLQSVCNLVLIRVVLARSATYLDQGRIHWRAISSMVAPSLKFAAMTLGGLLILQTDNIVIASVLGPAQVPNYQAVAKVIAVLMSLSMMLAMSSAPIMSQAHARGDIVQIVGLLSRNLRWTLAVMVTLGSFVACYMDQVIWVWLGQNHFVGYPIVWVLLIVMLLEAHHQAMASSTMAAGHIVFLWPALIAGMLNIVFSVWMARYYGLLGVALGTMMAQVMTNNWYAPYYTLRLFRIRFVDHLREVIMPACGLLLVTIGVGLGARMLTKGMLVLPAMLAGLLSTVVTGALCSLLWMTRPDERIALRSKIETLVRRNRSGFLRLGC